MRYSAGRLYGDMVGGLDGRVKGAWVISDRATRLDGPLDLAAMIA
jgi:hypothetical protein